MNVIYSTTFGDFEWDSEKAEANIKKHGIGFELALEAFNDPFQLVLPDKAHSIGEERYRLIGEIGALLLVFVVFTDRSTVLRERARIISARKATKDERRLYVAARGKSQAN